MTKVILQTNNDWTRKKIESAIASERMLLQKALRKSEERVQAFEKTHGSLDRDSMYGKLDDMELIEWEGEIEILLRLRKQFASLQEITIEHQ